MTLGPYRGTVGQAELLQAGAQAGQMLVTQTSGKDIAKE